MFRAIFCPSSGVQDLDFFTTYGTISCAVVCRGFRACCLALRLRSAKQLRLRSAKQLRLGSAKQHARKPLHTTAQDIVPYVVKKI
jgi:hypothetical protein